MHTMPALRTSLQLYSIHIHLHTFICSVLLHMYVYVYMYIHIHTPTYKFIHQATGWRRLMGSLKLQIIFHKKATKYRSLLWKMTYKDKGSYESSPPFPILHSHTSPYNPSCRTYMHISIMHIQMQFVCVYICIYVHVCV